MVTISLVLTAVKYEQNNSLRQTHGNNNEKQLY